VTDVRKEHCLCTIQFREFLGAATFFFVGISICEPGANLAREEIDESKISFVQAAIGLIAATRKPAGDAGLAAQSVRSPLRGEACPTPRWEFSRALFKVVDRENSPARQNVAGRPSWVGTHGSMNAGAMG